MTGQRVVIVTFDSAQILHVIGPMEVFSTATRLVFAAEHEVKLVSVSGGVAHRTLRRTTEDGRYWGALQGSSALFRRGDGRRRVRLGGRHRRSGLRQMSGRNGGDAATVWCRAFAGRLDSWFPQRRSRRCSLPARW
jgi:hypothetical protein